MKISITGLFLILVLNSLAQKSTHKVFIGANFTSTNVDYENSQGTNNKTFKDPKAGFIAGYKYIYSINPAIAVGAGIEFKTIKGKFTRGMVSNSPSGDIYPDLKENFKISRLSIPIQGYFNFVRKEKLNLYATTGLGFILSNKADRTADYFIPVSGSPDYIKLTYKGNQTIKFEKGDKSLGVSAFIGIGSDFNIKNQRFNAELSYCSDLSQNKFYTLRNIEDDGFFYTKFKSFQLNIGYTLPFSNNKNN